MIDSYSFGRVVVDGKAYTRDLIILPDRVLEGWRRREGHRVEPADLREAFAEKLEMLIVGTGYYGFMKVPAETSDWVKSRGVKLVVAKTAEACRTYNSLSRSGKAAAALHLTC
ncbi:MAG: Mth938-like domain-containing protein [Candidatus Bathyarchaeia archaeon]